MGKNFDIAELFEGSAESVLGTVNDNVVFQNPASVKLLGYVVGMSFSSLFETELPELGGTVNWAAATVCGRQVALRSADYSGLKVYFISAEKPALPGSPGTSLLSELKSELMVAKMAADRLTESFDKMKFLDPNVCENLAYIHHSCAKMRRLISNVSEVQDIELGRACKQTELFDIVSFCRDIVWTVQYFTKPKNIVVEFESSESSVNVYADRVMIETMLLNLISNSLLSVKRGGSVMVRVSRIGRNAVISVDDNGSGFPMDAVPQLMSGEGGGIGLRLVSAIMAMHGGSFLIEGRPGEGTSARATLPAADDICRLRGKNLEWNRGMDPCLVQLSTWLQNSDYDPRLMD